MNNFFVRDETIRIQQNTSGWQTFNELANPVYNKIGLWDVFTDTGVNLEAIVFLDGLEKEI